jgi:hypothetical protein
VSVEKLQVRQSPRQATSQEKGENQRGGSQSDSESSDTGASRRDQQRQEILRRMWRKLTGESDPLDMVA